MTGAVEVEPERPPADGVVRAGPAFPRWPTTKVSIVFEPPSSTTSTRAFLVNWICRGIYAPAPSSLTEPGIGRSPRSPSRRPAMVFEPALSTYTR